MPGRRTEGGRQLEEERPGYTPRVQVVLLQRAILMNEKKDKHGLFRLPGHVRNHNAFLQPSLILPPH